MTRLWLRCAHGCLLRGRLKSTRLALSPPYPLSNASALMLLSIQRILDDNQSRAKIAHRAFLRMRPIAGRLRPYEASGVKSLLNRHPETRFLGFRGLKP
uniref:Uncharacterized protein n=1 Tax=mine drainage metagenome TaxID=410659 RepID=E6PZ60_9ZZZZ